ncbi:MAG: hypothetical protein EBW61_13500 [Rhodobacteraceae bacterium]|nr:hypothetical protein [Paracoccaceae bacterium]
MIGVCSAQGLNIHQSGLFSRVDLFTRSIPRCATKSSQVPLLSRYDLPWRSLQRFWGRVVLARNRCAGLSVH